MTNKYDINIEKGSDTQDVFFSITDDGVPVDLTGYTARMQIREKPGSTILDELTTDNGRITIIEDTGVWTVTLKFPSATTDEYSFCSASYDVELIDASLLVDRVLQGKVTTDRNITT